MFSSKQTHESLDDALDTIFDESKRNNCVRVPTTADAPHLEYLVDTKTGNKINVTELPGDPEAVINNCSLPVLEARNIYVLLDSDAEDPATARDELAEIAGAFDAQLTDDVSTIPVIEGDQTEMSVWELAKEAFGF